MPVGFIVNFKNPKRFKFSIMTIVYTLFRDDALKMSPSILSFFLREMYFFFFKWLLVIWCSVLSSVPSGLSAWAIAHCWHGLPTQKICAAHTKKKKNPAWIGMKVNTCIYFILLIFCARRLSAVRDCSRAQLGGNSGLEFSGSQANSYLR